mmetsp:Transcript_1396/g.2503  ORF Transcript_1396/g.2503 Transcript_1396/m.2503 type:complete len:208 (+) Transcript_1396:1344-1967(+)
MIPRYRLFFCFIMRFIVQFGQGGERRRRRRGASQLKATDRHTTSREEEASATLARGPKRLIAGIKARQIPRCKEESQKHKRERKAFGGSMMIISGMTVSSLEAQNRMRDNRVHRCPVPVINRRVRLAFFFLLFLRGRMIDIAIHVKSDGRGRGRRTIISTRLSLGRCRIFAWMSMSIDVAHGRLFFVLLLVLLCDVESSAIVYGRTY